MNSLNKMFAKTFSFARDQLEALPKQRTYLHPFVGLSVAVWCWISTVENAVDLLTPCCNSVFKTRRTVGLCLHSEVGPVVLPVWGKNCQWQTAQNSPTHPLVLVGTKHAFCLSCRAHLSKTLWKDFRSALSCITCLLLHLSCWWGFIWRVLSCYCRNT